MRIISGKYKGRKLEGFDINGTRPTMDRVKESVFAMINRYIKGAVCLDLFAGSGAIGIEALSNGASKCYFIDNNSKVVNILKSNINDLGMNEEIHIINNDYKKALQSFSNENIKFDLIFLDPPYKKNIIDSILSYIHENNLLKDKGLIICEYEFMEIKSDDFIIFKEQIYGSKRIKIFKKKNI